MKDLVNATELRMIVKENEEVDIRRTKDRVSLVTILDEGPVSEDLCPLVEVKKPMEKFIQKNITKLRTQLTECTGHCTTFGCADGTVVNCYLKLKPLMKERK
jgi:hypothetical protein